MDNVSDIKMMEEEEEGGLHELAIYEVVDTHFNQFCNFAVKYGSVLSKVFLSDTVQKCNFQNVYVRGEDDRLSLPSLRTSVSYRIRHSSV